MYQSLEDTDKAMKVFDNLKSIIQLKTNDYDARDKLYNMLGLNTCEESVQVAAAA